MSDRQTANDIKKWLGLQNTPKSAAAKHRGKSIDKSIGNAGGSGGDNGYAGDDAPDGAEDNRTQEGVQNLSDALQTGDEPEKFELKDCETGEPVTLDGIGGNSTKAVPPIGFENCEAKRKPTMEDLAGKMIFRATYSTIYSDPNFESVTVYSLSSAEFYSFVSTGTAWAQSESTGGCPPQLGYVSDTGTSGSWTGRPGAYWRPGSGDPYCGYATNDRRANYTASTSTEYKQAYIDNFEAPTWDPNDKNHLSYNAEKGCIEPLCPNLNPHVLDKFKECQDEQILCDADGNKVHVKINADGTMDVTQQKHGQTATIKDGKVSSVKKITESQSERIFGN